jgi:hypothetical protein
MECTFMAEGKSIGSSGQLTHCTCFTLLGITAIRGLPYSALLHVQTFVAGSKPYERYQDPRRP